MKTTKIKLKKPIYMLHYFNNKFSNWKSYKTRPTRNSDQDIIYKVTQKTIVTIDKTDLTEIAKSSKGYDASVGHFNHLFIGDISEWLCNSGLNVINDQEDNSWDSNATHEQEGYKLNHRIIINNFLEDINDNFTASEVTIFLDEDAQVLPFNNADKKAVKAINDKEVKKQTFDVFIKDSVQPILEKYGMKIYGRNAAFKSYEALVTFIHEAIQDKINKEFNQIGLNITEYKPISKRKPANLYVCEPMFGFEGIDVMDQDSTNN